ncbi:MAG: hypothetical protein K9G76_00510 [Bacteroidales bacterium]|nr:hypothetical protein [Bacteroidales bacterium]MCF8402593.1 hypothetical protein [Bacteroidales bacterium]
MKIKIFQFLILALFLQISVSFSQNDLPLDAIVKSIAELGFGPVQNFSTGEGKIISVVWVQHKCFIFAVSIQHNKFVIVECIKQLLCKI